MKVHSRVGYEKRKVAFRAARSLPAVCALALGFASTLTGCGAATGGKADGDEAVRGEDLTDEDVRTVQQKVQSSLGGTHVFLDVLNTKQQATGVIFLPWASDSSTWASCGVTFVSPHFAITAAHCVPREKAPIDTIAFYVFNFNLDELAIRIIFGGDTALANKFTASQQVSGTFPNYTKGAALGSADGYRQMELTGFPICKARVRCAEPFGTENCPTALRNVDGGAGVDIALIECEFRDPSRPWTRVFTGSDSAGVAIESHWSHEYLNLSVQNNDGIGPFNNFATYGAYTNSDAGKLNNYHYSGLISNQFLPLVSISFPNGTPYRSTSSLTGSRPTGGGTSERFTDMFGCHGTSGSGVFPQDSDLLLGPTIHGSGNLSGRLCADPTRMGPGVNSMSFVRPMFTRQIEALSLVQNDR